MTNHDNWVPYPINTRLTITNAAGRSFTGIFKGYRDECFALLQLADDDSFIFARDATITLADDTTPASKAPTLPDEPQNIIKEIFYERHYARAL